MGFGTGLLTDFYVAEPPQLYRRVKHSEGEETLNAHEKAA